MPPAGRPRTFDREGALKKAMYVFWEKGYEGTTMSDLIAIIGMKAPSVYAAFGNKDKLFSEALGMYQQLVLDGPIKALFVHGDITKALTLSLKSNVNLFAGNVDTGQPGSCLIMTAAINCSPEHNMHVETLRQLRGEYKKALETRFSQAKSENQLSEDASPKALAEYFTTFVHGMALRARDGSSKKELEKSCTFALQALASLAKPHAN